MQATAGLDCGSAACKGALVAAGEVLATAVRPTGWNPRETAEAVLDEMLEQAACPRDGVTVVATGYGRVGIDFAHRRLTEITCHARGAEHLLPGVRCVVDIGGQDSKVIQVEEGRVRSFQMNDKCAAGTGRFLEMSAHRMGVDLSGFAALVDAGRRCALTSMCAVFADSEIVSLLAAGKSREEVAGGIVDAVAARAVALAARVPVAPPVLLTGGLADFDGLRAALEAQLGFPVAASPRSRYAGAIGAALLGGK